MLMQAAGAPALNKRTASKNVGSISSVLGLSAGALGWSSLAEAARDDLELKTILLPDHYLLKDDGTVIIQLETGERLSLKSDQYVILDGGLLLVIDEVAQNALSTLPVMGSLRTQLFTETQPVRDNDGAIVEASDSQPIWSGEGDAPHLFDQVDIERYELAQENGDGGNGNGGNGGGGLGGAAAGAGLGLAALGLGGGNGGSGDGGNSGGTTQNQPAPNNAPVITSSVKKPLIVVYTGEATDPDGDLLTWSIKSVVSDDVLNNDPANYNYSQWFTINDSTITFDINGAQADFDLNFPGLNNGDTWTVVLEVSDGNGGFDQIELPYFAAASTA